MQKLLRFFNSAMGQSVIKFSNSNGYMLLFSVNESDFYFTYSYHENDIVIREADENNASILNHCIDSYLVCSKHI